MRMFLLLVAALMAGHQVSSELKACEGNWLEFTFRSPKGHKQAQPVKLVTPRGKELPINRKDEWIQNKNIFLYHDTRNKYLKVAIKPLQKDDAGTYSCLFYGSTSPKMVEEELEMEDDDDCQKPATQLANKAATTNITCNYPNKYHKMSMFVCKDSGFLCKKVSSAKSKSSGAFGVKDGGFTVSLGHVTSAHDGIYWCGVRTGRVRTAVRQITLKVEDGRQRPAGVTVAIVSAVLLLLLLLLVLVFIYKRIARSRHKGEEDVQNTLEDHHYDEIQERPQKPDSGTAIQTIYATAVLPASPLAFTPPSIPQNSSSDLDHMYYTVNAEQHVQYEPPHAGAPPAH